MRAIFSTLSLALLASLAAAPARTAAEPTFVEFNEDLTSSLATNGISFLSMDPERVPAQQFLLGMNAAAEYGSTVVAPPTASYAQCAVSNTTEATGKVTVLIAISKCLGAYAQDQILAWARGLKETQNTFFKNGLGTSAIEFMISPLPGTCQAVSEANEQGQASMLMSSEVLPEDVERLAAFSAVGRVLTSMPTTGISSAGTTANIVVDKTVPIAVISFVDNYKSFETVQQYELTEKISKTFNFQICQNGENCGGQFQDCITLQDPVDVFMYSPFKVVSKFQCTGLTGGIPVTYVDARNVRQCVCTCPAGTTLNAETKKCVATVEGTCVCVWENALSAGSYKILISDASESTKFTKIGTVWNIPAPIPLDNYVAKGRVNQNDDNVAPYSLSKGPRIDLTTKRICSVSVYTATIGATLSSELTSKSSYAQVSAAAKTPLTLFADAKCSPLPQPTTKSFPWKTYQSNRVGAIDSLEFPTYGKYALELFAADYNQSATCPGCVAIVDGYRPHAEANNCPKRFCDDAVSDCTDKEGVVEFNITTITTTNTLVGKFYNFDSTSTNDACSRTSSDRCDAKAIRLKQFGDSDYVSTGIAFDDGKTFFNKDKVTSDLKAKLAIPSGTNAVLKGQLDTPVANGECKRCIDVGIELREWWVDYKCGRDYDIRKCEGDASAKCSFSQCLVVLGDSIVVATAALKSPIKDESTRVIAELTQQGYNTETQVHVALQCTQFVDNANAAALAATTCKYTTKVENLLDISAVAKDTSVFSNADASSFVNWRYRVDTGSWQQWGTSTSSVNFVKAETMITVEAWTQCGLARKFFFYVNLHLNNDVKVCDNFRSMWYQTTNEKLDAPDDLCQYPSSDFAELTFDYHANIGLQYSPDKLTMNISSVVCRINYFLPTTGDTYSTAIAYSVAEILRVERLSPEIVTRFAIESIRSPTTLPKTNIHVTCDFSYKQYGTSALVLQTCNQDFAIRDCTGPTIDKPCLDDKQCLTETCPANKLAPYEACGGNVVSAGAGKTTSFLNAPDRNCCAFCSSFYETSCKTISTLPAGEDDIKRCEPVKKSTIGGTYAGSLLAATEALKQAAQQGPTSATTVLLSASTLVALVALVVVKRRHTRVNKDAVMEDAYYPLLN